jgi:hypothetical protein
MKTNPKLIVPKRPERVMKTRSMATMTSRETSNRLRTSTAKAIEALATKDNASQVQSAAEGARAASETQYKTLIDLLVSQNGALMKALEDQKQTTAKQIEALTKAFMQQFEALKTELKTELAAVQAQLASVRIPTSASPSYAEIARTPPISQPSNLSSLASTTPSTMTDTIYCTVDTSRVREEDKDKIQPGAIRGAIEKEMRNMADHDAWRCAAVIRDPKNASRIRVTCRDEDELRLVKEATQKTAAPGVRVMRDQLYPVKIDNANRTAILNQDGSIRSEAAEVFGKENGVRIAKMAWLSNKELAKTYGSMVIYVTKGSDAVRLLQEQYFHIAGESAYTRVYEPRMGPIQCYNCQEIGHKAFSCKKAQVCGKCAREGHHHRDCAEEVPKCVPCGGPHESFSRYCPKLRPPRHE